MPNAVWCVFEAARTLFYSNPKINADDDGAADRIQAGRCTFAAGSCLTRTARPHLFRHVRLFSFPLHGCCRLFLLTLLLSLVQFFHFNHSLYVWLASLSLTLPKCTSTYQVTADATGGTVENNENSIINNRFYFIYKCSFLSISFELPSIITDENGIFCSLSNSNALIHSMYSHFFMIYLSNAIKVFFIARGNELAQVLIRNTFICF